MASDMGLVSSRRGPTADHSTFPLRVALVGLGASGRAVGKALLDREGCQVVAATDVDPTMLGLDLGDLLGAPPLGVPVGAGASPSEPVDVAVVATTARLSELEPTVASLLESGVHVLSLCEELAYPWASHPVVAGRLDRLARSSGVSLLGCGCNPGFIMDTLPLVLGGLTHGVQRVEMERTADLSPYGAVVREFGVGLTPAEFAAAAATDGLAGHVGYEQSAAMLADGLGWSLDAVDVEPVRPAIIAAEERVGPYTRIEAGTVAAVTQIAKARSDGRTMIDIAMHFGFFAPGDAFQVRDVCRLHSAGGVLEVVAPHGYDSFAGSVALAANLLPALVELEPGLRTMADVRVADFTGARR